MIVLRPFENQEKTILLRSKIEHEIIKAFQARKIDNLNELLSEKGVYFGLSKRIFIAKMENLFKQYENCSCEYVFGVANQASTCNKVHEFTYTKEYDGFEGENNNNSVYLTTDFLLGRTMSNNQFRIQLFIEFEEYEVVKIAKPIKTLSLIDFFHVREGN
jgi:hypothetical protein